MAIAKVCGIETEYGIQIRGGDSNPVSASSALINAYVSGIARNIGWDFVDEHPLSDARGFSHDDAFVSEVETHLVNAVLTNGARYYVDHAHPEISTPECRDAREVVCYDRAAEEIIRLSMDAAKALLPDHAEIVTYKNNSDGKGNSYGCHENYLLDRQVPFGRIVAEITPHFVTRQVFCGAGKVGSEVASRSQRALAFQLSQRADFFEEEVGLETTMRRPIVNTRDEPHCDPNKYRRLHVIIGDANMSEIATYLKVGTTAIVLAMIEDDVIGDDLQIVNPVAALRRISADPSLAATVTMRNGKRMTALDIQWELLERAAKYESSHGLDSVVEQVGADVLQRWHEVLAGLESDPDSMAHCLDWVAKRRLVEAYAERHRLSADDVRLKALDLQYHDMRAERCLAQRVGLETLCESSEVQRAITEPPASTRAYFRGTCLQRWPDRVVAANWDSMVFDVDRGPLRRVPMMEPLRGTAVHVGELLDSCSSAIEMLERLGE